MTETSERDHKGLGRRGLLGSTATLAGMAGLAAGGSSVALMRQAMAQPRGSSAEVKPGDLDEYYGFSSGGQSGELRIIGLPSSRELLRIPVFNRCSATGWGITNESRKILTDGMLPATKAFLEKRGGGYDYYNGDTHHPHMSFTDGTYDGRYHLRQ